MEDETSDFEDERPEIDIENIYYHAKSIKEEDPLFAIEEFKRIIPLETTKGSWGFRSLKQIMKLLFKLGHKQNMIEYYKRLLTYTKSPVTKNYSEKSIQNILDYVSLDNDVEFMEEIYSETLKSLKEIKNERLWLSTNLKRAKLWLNRKEYSQLNKILVQLYEVCKNYSGSTDQWKDAYFFEIYSLQIQMYFEVKNNKRVKELYHQMLKIKSLIIHPYIMGIIKESSGKIHMEEKLWEEAQIDFFESFKNYNEADSPYRIRVLKYLILANMLNGTNINLSDFQEINPYKDDPQFLAMINLMNVYHQGDIQKIEFILKEHYDEIMADIFIQSYVDDILRNIRTQALLRLLSSYTKINIPFIEEKLKIPSNDLEMLLINLILDQRIQGKIDQVNQILTLEAKKEPEQVKDAAVHELADSVDRLWQFCLGQR
ncbi:hypothetical protein PCANB_002222 [Pneumocystis canis]|nr:hypothetical protein PCANB_002222 [Pneumocystis canis]